MHAYTYRRQLPVNRLQLYMNKSAQKAIFLALLGVSGIVSGIVSGM